MIFLFQSSQESDDVSSVSPSPLPSMISTGRGYQKVVVSVDRLPIGTFSRSNGLEAHAALFAAFYKLWPQL